MNPFRQIFPAILALAVIYVVSAPNQAAHATGATFTNTPAAISNTYNGAITLQIGGLSPGETVVVQKFLDLNANGVVDSKDLLVQQFQLTDGQGPPAIAGITNVNIPGDLNPASGAITAQLNLIGEGSQQLVVGQYLLKLSSPSNNFTPVTNLFVVTNFPFTQSFTGNVVSNGTSTLLSNAVVFLLALGNNFQPLAGTLANGSGNYAIKAPPGTYKLVALKGLNWVTDVGNAPVLTLGSNATITTNLSLLPATQTISGRVVDATNASFGLPGLLLAAVSSNQSIWGFGITDTNGAFALPVNSAGQWGIGQEQQEFDFLGYVTSKNGTNAIAGSTNVTIAFPKATALIYGTVRDGSNNPIIGLRMQGQNGNGGSGIYQGDGTTLQNGNYVVGVVPANWDVEVDQGSSGPRFANYIFAQGPPWAYNNGGNGTNITAGTAVQANFTALTATGNITGYVKDTNGNPIAGVGVSANATISNVNFFVGNSDTDTNGYYSLPVANGNWNVNLNCCACCGSSDFLPTIYQCPGNASVNIANSNAMANFTVQPAIPDVTDYQMTKQENFVQTGQGTVAPSTNSPFQAKFTIDQSSPGTVNSATITPPGGTAQPFPTGGGSTSLKIRASFASQALLDAAYPSGSYLFNFSTQNSCSNLTPVLNLPSTVFPNAPQVTNFSAAQMINAASDFIVQWNSFIGGTTNDTIDFSVNDTNGNTIVSSPNYLSPGWLNGTATAFTIPGGTLVSGQTYQAQLGFSKIVIFDTNSYPGAFGVDGFESKTTFTIGAESGTTTNSGFVIMAPKMRSNGGFQFTINTAAGVNYTIQISSDLKTWFSTGIVSDSSGGALTFVDLTAGTTGQRFYRVQVGP